MSVHPFIRAGSALSADVMKPVHEQQRGNAGSSAKRQTAVITESKQGVCQDYTMSASLVKSGGEV